MNKIKLEDYKDGAIYKYQDGRYLIETPKFSAEGNTLKEALSKLYLVTNMTKKSKKKKTIDD